MYIVTCSVFNSQVLFLKVIPTQYLAHQGPEALKDMEVQVLNTG